MRTRTILSVLAAAGLLGAFVVPNIAGAKPGPDDGYDFGENHYQMISDQEDAVTNAQGKVRLCFNEQPVDINADNGHQDPYTEPTDVTAPTLGRCATDGSTVAFEQKAQNIMVELAANLDRPGNAPVVVQQRFHQRDGAVLVFLNKEMQPISGETVRFLYTAVGTQAAAAPEPEPSASPAAG